MNPRRSPLALVLPALLVACGGGSGSGGGGSPPPAARSATQILVSPTSSHDLDDLVSEKGAKVLGPVAGTSYYVVEVPAGEDLDKFLEECNGDGRVVEAEEDAGVRFPEGGLSTIPLFGDDPLAAVASQPAMAQIGAVAAHGRATGLGMRIAVIDTGVRADHPLLATHVDPDGWDFVTGGPNPTDVGNGLDDNGNGLIDEGVGHGTFVASLILAVAPDAHILPLRALNSDAVGTASSVANAIAYAVDHGVQVINLSAGLPQNLKVIAQAVAAARQAGIPVIAAAGNRSGAVDFPAALSDAEAVTAVDGGDRWAPFASFGSAVRISAPGVDLVGAHPLSPSGTARWSGTSFSTALVSGAYAVVRQQRPLASPSSLLQLLEDTAAPLDLLNPFVAGGLGRGRLDAGAATAAP